jgi:hypothetical protein
MIYVTAWWWRKLNDVFDTVYCSYYEMWLRRKDRANSKHFPLHNTVSNRYISLIAATTSI